jgi:hypothetical protein
MNLTIESRILGKSITFSRPGSGYIYADLNGSAGTLGNQICEGGSTSGSTITYRGDDREVFNKKCRNWYKSYIKKHA